MTIDSGEAGPVLVVTGAVHGNEKCGTKAIRRILKHIEAGEIKITAGKLIAIPICNPRAYDQDVRFTERNLNRMMFPKDAPVAYEDHLDNILCPVFEKADVMLDLHSYHSKGPPFVCLAQETEEELSFARILGAQHYIHGWSNAFGNSDAEIDPRTSQGTTEYARLFGALGLVLECGNHHDPNAPEVGFQAILATLNYCDIADIDPALVTAKEEGGEEHCVALSKTFYKKEEGRFPQDWKNLGPVKKGEVLGIFESGDEIIAPEDGYIAFPREDELVGEDWFLFGVKSDLMVRNG